MVEPPHLPLPGSERDPRQSAIAATVGELERLGIRSGYQTLLVAGGLARRAGHSQLETLVSPEFARRFHGHVEVHDVERDDLVELESSGSVPLRVHPALVNTDVVVVVTAAETVLHGGPAAFVGASGAETLRASGADSLLETSGSRGWRLARELERALARRVPTIGVSLVLNHPRVGGTLGGYPYEREALERVSRSPFRQVFGALPGRLRTSILRSLPLERSAAAAYAGPPSVAHTEALLRGVELRGTTLDGPLDALCVGIPHTTPYLPREQPNPLLGALPRPGVGAQALARLTSRSRREARPSCSTASSATSRTRPSSRTARSSPPLAPGRTPLRSRRPSGTRARTHGRSRPTARVAPATRGCRSPTGTHASPLIGRLGHVLVAGCRDHAAARQLGFVPTHGIGAALTMVQGWSERPPRVGFLLSPPYFPLRVAS